MEWVELGVVCVARIILILSVLVLGFLLSLVYDFDYIELTDIWPMLFLSCIAVNSLLWLAAGYAPPIVIKIFGIATATIPMGFCIYANWETYFYPCFINRCPDRRLCVWLLAYAGLIAISTFPYIKA